MSHLNWTPQNGFPPELIFLKKLNPWKILSPWDSQGEPILGSPFLPWQELIAGVTFCVSVHARS